MAVWRKIWQDSIKAGKKTLVQNDQKGKIFEELKEEYPGDAMVIFEEAIAFDCMKNYKRAIELYQKAYQELPVKHWKENANYFLQKAIIKNTNQTIAKLTSYDAKSVVNEDEVIKFKLDAYFNLHSYYHLSETVRYLAIFSMSRIDTESNMAIAIFRTCLEVALKQIYKKEFGVTDDELLDDMKLCDVINELDANCLIDDMTPTFKKIKGVANDAIHKAKVFTPRQIAETIVLFDYAMDFLDKKYKELKI